MVWMAILTLAAVVTVYAVVRCRQANKLIQRIFVEELGAPPPTAHTEPPPPHQPPREELRAELFDLESRGTPTPAWRGQLRFGTRYR